MSDSRDREETTYTVRTCAEDGHRQIAIEGYEVNTIRPEKTRKTEQILERAQPNRRKSKILVYDCSYDLNLMSFFYFR